MRGLVMMPSRAVLARGGPGLAQLVRLVMLKISNRSWVVIFSVIGVALKTEKSMEPKQGP